MKQTVFLLMLVIASTLFSHAQKNKAGATGKEYAYSKGDKLLNIGVGINSYYSGGFPLGASFEVGVTDVLSVGASVDFLSYNYDYYYTSNYSNKFTAIYIGARGSYHFNELINLGIPKLDIYAGGTLGYRRFSFNDDYYGSVLSGSYGSGIFLGAFAGGKYYFNSKIGGFVELGAIGSTNARVGLALKF